MMKINNNKLKNKHDKIIKVLSVSLASFLVLTACSDHKQEQKVSTIEELVLQDNRLASSLPVWPKLELSVKIDVAMEVRITDILASMTLAQKIAQMIQPEIRDITIEDM